ncbi:hypothetical protein G6O67_000511 [Ophiocordyceps sinensis]|uniref:Uncharacterized protein n=2 Tax=Ophiocordyceps sinensis TaxID=72228 RepID=A0A8H4V9Q7_9HYPO|nr:hypothetical protein OCS_00756 [Ophiocordyceps sinensis CO18]KAF4513212.1 hypothetical protein G6O67_000511 [Ophiocordyceps sinensis]
MPDSPSVSFSTASSSPPSASTAAPPTAAPANGFGDTRGIKFQIKTGNARWVCTLQDRASYERMKATRGTSAGSSMASSPTSSSPPMTP